MIDLNTNIPNPSILITGGSGFLGKAIIRELLCDDALIKPKEIRVFDIKKYEGDHLAHINFIKGDIQDLESLKRASENVDLIIHSAAIIDWGVKSDEEVLAINVGGTENVLQACIENKVRKLVYTSSLDAVYTGSPLRDIDESQAYPEKHQTSYCRSKYLSEKMVVNANSKELQTCILRPSDIYGEEDPYHIDPLIDMAKSGFYIRLGNGSSKCQHVYVGNMAHAHILAAKALIDEDKKVEGEIYFITEGAGTNFFRFFDRIVLEAGYKIRPKNLWLPKWLAYPMASLTEFSAFLVSPFKKYDVKFSRFAVDYTCNDFTFTSEKAKRDFGFVPKYSLEEAIDRTIEYYKKRN